MGLSGLELPCPPLALPTCRYHPHRTQCKAPYLTWQLFQWEIQDTPVIDKHRIIHLWKTIFLASPRSSSFSIQVQEFSSLWYVIEVHGTQILARMPYVVYELRIKSIHCLRLLWNFHLLGKGSLLFLEFWNTRESYFLFLVQYFGSTFKLMNLLHITAKRKVANLLQESLGTLHPMWQVNQSQWSLLAVKNINSFNKRNLI